MDFIYAGPVIKARLTLPTRLVLAPSRTMRLTSNACSIDKVCYVVIALESIVRKLRTHVSLRTIINNGKRAWIKQHKTPY